MLSSSNRLSTSIFKHIIQNGGVFHGNFFIIRCEYSKDLSHFAVSVPKKVAKTAVLRNKIRRRVYSIIRKFKDSFISKQNIVFIAKKDIEKVSFIELTDEIRKIFVKCGLLK